MSTEKRMVLLAGVAVAFIWGLTFLSIKVAIREFGPMSLALFRFVIASILLTFIMLITRTPFGIARKDMLLLTASGLVGVTLYFFFENNGVMRLTASESSIIVGTIPVVTLLGEMLILKHRPDRRVAGGIVLSFVGVALIVFRSESASSAPEGYLYMGGAALSWAAYSFLTRPLSGKYSMLAVTFWQMVTGALGCIPFALAEHQNWSSLSWAALLNASFLGVFGSAIGYWLYVIALERLGPGASSVFINLIPVVAVAASFVLLGERLGLMQLAGGLMAVLGVYLATTPRRISRPIQGSR